MIGETIDRVISISHSRNSVLGGKSGKDTCDVEIRIGREFMSKAFCLSAVHDNTFWFDSLRTYWRNHIGFFRKHSFSTFNFVNLLTELNV